MVNLTNVNKNMARALFYTLKHRELYSNLANNSTIDTNILNKTIKQKKIFDKIRDL